MTKKKERPQLTPEQIIQLVRDRCDEVGDCWLWKAALTGGGKTPNMRHPNRRNEPAVSTRVVVLEALGNERPSPDHWASNTCNENHCCSPEHAAWRTRTDKLRDLGREGKWSTVELSMKKAVIFQAYSPLDWDKVRDIRSRPSEQTNKALAKEFSVDPNTIRRVRRHESWVEYRANPFAGLFTSLAANDSTRRRA